MLPMQMKSDKRHLLRSVLLCTVLLLAAYGCSTDNPLVAAPIGSIAPLEKLADSYKQIESSYPSNKTSLPPARKREFIDRVFSLSGYDYTLTLLSMGEMQLDAKNKNQKDLAELLLVPTVGLSSRELADIYSIEEVRAFKKLKATF